MCVRQCKKKKSACPWVGTGWGPVQSNLVLIRTTQKTWLVSMRFPFKAVQVGVLADGLHTIRLQCIQEHVIHQSIYWLTSLFHFRPYRFKQMYPADTTHLFNVKLIVHLWVGSSASLQHWFPKSHEAFCKYTITLPSANLNVSPSFLLQIKGELRYLHPVFGRSPQ